MTDCNQLMMLLVAPQDVDACSLPAPKACNCPLCQSIIACALFVAPCLLRS
jgi:hypothetical protein